MKTINDYIQDANNKVEQAAKAEDNYCINKAKANAAELLEQADKTYRTARVAVRKVYIMFGVDPPKMPGVYTMRICMDVINREYPAFWEAIANNK